MELYEYRNEIPLNTLGTWRRLIMETARFQPTGWTGLSKEPYRHWAYYPEYEGVYKQMFECMNHSFKEDSFNLKPERIIVNMYNHGDSSWLHTDGDDSKYWTAILFMNEYWDLNWGGDFVLVENNEILKAVAPTPGKFVLFRGNILHGARPVSREAEFARMGVAFQCSNSLKT
jgi:hypothetical protein